MYAENHAIVAWFSGSLIDELTDFPKPLIYYYDYFKISFNLVDPEMQGEGLNGQFGFTDNCFCMIGDVKVNWILRSIYRHIGCK